MGLFDEIIKTVQEAVAEAKAQGNAGRVGPVAPPAARRLHEDADAVARRLAQAQQAQRAQQAPAGRSGQAVARQERAQAVAAAHAKEAAGVRAVDAARAIRREQERRALVSASPALRIAAKLRDPQAVRDAFVLAEILQPPLALRRRR